MEINRLLGDELSYELRVRNAPDHGTVQEKRSRLRGLMRLERLGGSIAFTPIVDVDAELETCRIKLNDITYLVQEFDAGNAANEHSRLQSRILHVINRLNRISDPRAEQFKSQLISQCATLTATLEDIMDYRDQNVSARQKSLIDAPIELLPEVIPRSQQATAPPVPLAPLIDVPANETQLGSSRVRFEDAHSPQDPIDSANPLPTVSQLNFAPSSTPPNNHFRNSAQPLAIAPFPSVNSVWRQPIAQHPNPPRYGTHSHIAREVVQPEYPHLRTSPIHTQNQVDVSREVCADVSSLGRRVRDLMPNNASPSPYHPGYASDRDAYDESSRSCFITVTKWQITFDGKGSVTHFLQRIEELRVASGVSKPQLLKCASMLFSGSTLEWYRANRSAIRTWDDLVHQLKVLYLTDDYEESILETIHNRTQRIGEKSAIYIAVMENYYNQLFQKPPEPERLVTIRRRLLPYLQNKLVMHEGNIKTIAELTSAVRHIENTFAHTQKLRTPTVAGRYEQNRRVGDSVHAMVTEPVDEGPVHQPSVIPTTQPQPQVLANPQSIAAIVHPDVPPTSLARGQQLNRTIRCYNCNQVGHHRINCAQPLVIRCYKCNAPNYTVRTCPNCTGNASQVQGRIEP